MNPGSQEPAPGDPLQPGEEREAEPSPSRLELPDAATELLAIVRYITADDGPLQTTPDPGDLSPWHERALLKALERLEVIDHYLRGRVAFFVAGKDHGYGSFDEELDLAGAALDVCRAAARVVDVLLAGRLPTEPELEAMSGTTEKVYPALKALLRSGRG
jgi:hypothetical protein